MTVNLLKLSGDQSSKDWPEIKGVESDFFEELDLEIEIPQAFRFLKVKSVSAEIKVKSLKINEKAEFKSVSGEAEFSAKN